MGGICGKKEKLGFDWDSIDPENDEINLDLKQKKNVKRVFSILNDADKNENFVLEVFAKLFSSHPEILNYFNSRINPNKTNEGDEGVRSRFKENYGDEWFQYKVEDTLINPLFVGHMGAVTDTLKMLVDLLEDEPRFYEKCRELMFLHGKMPGIRKVYFRNMMESIDEVLGGRYGYKGPKRKDTLKFLTCIYINITKRIQESSEQMNVESKHIADDGMETESPAPSDATAS